MARKRKRNKRRRRNSEARTIEFQSSGIVSKILALAVLVEAIERLVQALMGPN